jgi:hypothetical protein
VTEDGKVCILVGYPGAELKALVDHFHLKSITPGDTTEGAKKVRLFMVSEYIPRLIKYGGRYEMVKSNSGGIESKIITSMLDKEKMKE